MSAQTPSSRTLAEKLDRLFRTVRSRGASEYTYREVAEGIRAQGGPKKMSATYLWLLRTGVRDNPSRKHLEAIAVFFGVPVSCLFDEAVTAQIDAELQLVRALRDAPVRHIAVRAADLSSQGLSAIADMVEHVRRIEGIPDAPRSEALEPEQQRATSTSE
jgi:transcriptional regulator with XRE-family HTH domain